MDHAGGSSSGGGGASESNWPQSLNKPLMQELYGFGLLVPSGCRLAKSWRICKDGYPTLDNPATPEQLRVHPSGRYNICGRHDYWDGNNNNDVIRRYRQAATSRVAVGRRSPTHLRRPRWRPRLSRRSNGVKKLREDGDPTTTGATQSMRASLSDAQGGKGRGGDRGGDPGDGGSGGKPATRRR
ncbi:hypothetical protein ZWY2020_000581 [Hordeum vulgare]|nr:hypothetical protein ZWY2020_000581 [Hordeum vulgare]